MEINSKTRLCCLIGHPVKHSISPNIHNTLFQKLNLNYVYLAFDIDPKDLRSTVRGFRAMNVLGFNVTIPHKINVIKYLDKIDSSAKESGSVNTVVNRGGELVGYNTDIDGIINSLKDVEYDNCGRALVIGAGGVARAAIVALRNLGLEDIIVCNRRLWRAAALVRKFRNDHLKMKAISISEASRYSRNASIIINATPIGMWPNVDETPLNSHEISRNAVVLDLVYNPLKTKLIIEAEKAGAKTITGLKPLIEQAAKAFMLWTSIDPPRELMWSVAEKTLKEIFRNEG
ncbi:MAG: shikimate dehydrogenase [Nitrososphaerota archaeon]